MNAFNTKSYRKFRVIDQKGVVTGMQSQICRFIAWGLLVFFFAKGEPPYPMPWLIIGTSATLFVLMDYLQYYFGSRSVEETMRSKDISYDSDSFNYRARGWLFFGKQYVIIPGILALAWLVIST